MRKLNREEITKFFCLSECMGLGNDFFEKMFIYWELLIEYNAKFNLVSKTSLQEAYGRHFLDSFQLVFFLRERPRKWIDIGSGAGFPGLVVALFYPCVKFYLVESVRKKCVFLDLIVKKLDLKNVLVCNERFEKMSFIQGVGVVSARAVCSCEKLLEYCSTYLRRGAVCLFMLGENQKTDFLGEKTFLRIEEYRSIVNYCSRVVRVSQDFYR